jgi:hypothetical protein
VVEKEVEQDNEYEQHRQRQLGQYARQAAGKRGQGFGDAVQIKGYLSGNPVYPVAPVSFPFYKKYIGKQTKYQ